MDPDADYFRNKDDAQLVELVLDGQVAAFEVLVQKHHGPLIAFLSFFRCPGVETEDVAQEAFIKCFKHLDQFDTTRKFRNWLYTIARRSIPKHRAEWEQNDLAGGCEASVNCDPSLIAERLDHTKSIWSTVRSATSDDEFQMIWFRYGEQMAHAEIAEVMQRSTSSIKMQLSRLRKRLKSHLAPFVDHSELEKVSFGFKRTAS